MTGRIGESISMYHVSALSLREKETRLEVERKTE